MAHLLNPYLILVSAFLFSAGFAVGSPAHSSVIAEMVSKDDLASAYTLVGMQMDLSGIIGPLFSALLLPLAGVSFIFGANGLGFLLMFLTLLQWKRVKVQSFIIPWARARYSPQRITTFADLVLVLDFCLMAVVHRPYVFLVVAALGGMGWTISASELWVASQRAMPDWARGRMNATMVMVAQAATALGGVIWGLAAHHGGVVPAFLGAAVFALVLMIVVRVVPALQISIDFTKSLSFESAPVSIFSQNLDPGRVLAPQDGPVSITAEFNVDPTRRNECIELMRDARMIFLRNGANRWHLYGDLDQPNIIRMEVVVPSWKQHLLQRERMTKDEQEVLLKLRSLRTDPKSSARMALSFFGEGSSQ